MASNPRILVVSPAVIALIEELFSGRRRETAIALRRVAGLCGVTNANELRSLFVAAGKHEQDVEWALGLLDKWGLGFSPAPQEPSRGSIPLAMLVTDPEDWQRLKTAMAELTKQAAAAGVRDAEGLRTWRSPASVPDSRA